MLKQTKLLKSEWDSIEIPIADAEKGVIRFMIESYDTNDCTRKIAKYTSLIQFLKLKQTPDIDEYLYQHYFEKPKVMQKIKKADQIRIQQNSLASISHCWECVVLDAIKDAEREPYKLFKLLQSNVPCKNAKVDAMAKAKLESLKLDTENVILTTNFDLQFEDMELYSHQKQLFTEFRKDAATDTRAANLIFYVAPTGTGKTLTPLVLASQFRVIFVCAARHVGLSLARAAISVDKKVAFAFGCESTEDIRLHNAAATIFKVDKRSGRICKIDHTVGPKVEIMISDVHSFTHAMFYMKAFNDVNNLVFFWDEPTISLDVAEHPLHAEIQAVWRHNLIPNVILSSATLPKLESLPGLVKSFSDKFEDNRINYICTFDLKKSIPLLTSDGYILMPHYMYDDYDKILQLVNHCMCNLTMLRYLDLTDILRFLGLVEEKGFVVESLFLKRKFVALEDISVENIKLHYLEVLGNIKSGCWGLLYLECAYQRKRMYPLPTDHAKDVWGVYLSTWDAFTLTDGPTIFLTKDADKIAKFLIQKSCIPVEILKGIYADIEKNSQLSVRLQKIATKLGSGEEERSSKGSEKGSNKSKKEEAAEEKVLTGQQRKLQEEEMALLAQLKMVELSEMYVPNKPLHLRHWNRDRLCNSFCSDISSSIVTRVMAIADVSDDFKLLLLMGIGVFSSTIVNNDYLEVMKELANDQKLYLIVASGDYVFGTNYQFCHAYLSKDLDLTQEKMVQCIGRVGRKQTQQNYTIRLRDDKCGETLFMPQVNAMEIENMNRLFS